MVTSPLTLAVSRREPLTAQGQRTQRALLRAARRTFERKGYLGARVSDIAKAARVSVGTFYLYFDSKRAAFDAVVVSLQDELLEIVARDVGGRRASALHRVRDANVRYFEAYRRDARIWTAIEEAALVDRRVGALVRQRWQRYNDRIAAAIERWVEAGEARPIVAPARAAEMLGAMTERCAQLWLGPTRRAELPDAAEEVTKVWAHVLGLRYRPPRTTIVDDP